MLRHPKKKNPESEPAAPPLPASPETGPVDPAVPVCEPAPEQAAAAPAAIDCAALERELAAARERYLRLMADFENARKRQAREREETIRRANEELLHALLPVLDHLELALASPVQDRDAAFARGVQMVADQFVAVLHKFDLKPVTALGETFDPGRHEALTQLPAAGVPAGQVIQQLRRGWSLSGRLLRPAQVIVSCGEPEAAATPTNPSV